MKQQPLVDEKIKAFENLCRERGLALTIQRRIILENLSSRYDHPTADQIYEAVKDQIRGVSRTTVYRVLETFVRLGVVAKVSNPHAKARFEADTVRHHHLICLDCNSVADCHDGRLDGIEVPTENCDGFEVRDFSIAITGLCSSCRREKTL
jgi:Fur family peroxide stress response transcriptional regulator